MHQTFVIHRHKSSPFLGVVAPKVLEILVLRFRVWAHWRVRYPAGLNSAAC